VSSTAPRIGIIGDFDGRPSHLATQEALEHSASFLNLKAQWEWISTEALLTGEKEWLLSRFDRLLCAPGIPYRSQEGALRGIQAAREQGIPFLGTCGGCQHSVLEFARNKLGFFDADHAETSPSGSDLWITPMSCSLSGQEARIQLVSDSLASHAYGERIVIERFRCSFGIDPGREAALDQKGLRATGRDEDGQIVVIELMDHPFFMGTLFQPQLSSSPSRPHPLINALLLAP
jgi:CTP synthase (UTP-ammonia lyase)